MKLRTFSICLILLALCVVSCEKDFPKGDYRGTFTGDFAADSLYTTVYDFEVTRSTKKELWLKEKQSQVTSKLKKHADNSISGMIGFAGKMYNSNHVEFGNFQFIKVEGNYHSGVVEGTFSLTLAKGEQQYHSKGTFILEPF
jgi:hypothetical protein